MHYPSIRIDTNPDALKGTIAVWLKYCGHLTEERFNAAVEHYLTGSEGGFAISPGRVLAADREIYYGPRPLMPPRSW